MDEYEQYALHGSALSLAAATLAYVASFVYPPSSDVAAVFGIFAVLFLAPYYFFDRPRTLAGAWVPPTVAAIVTLASGSTQDQQLPALTLAALSVVGFVTYPIVAYAARLGENAGDFLR